MSVERRAGAPAADRALRRQGRETLARLLDAGMEVFRTRGYHAARVDDIVRTAQTSHGTFYLYFANKDDLLRTLAHECAAEMQAISDGLGPVTPDATGRAELRRWVEGFYRTYERYGVVIRVWMEGQGQVGDRRLIKMGTDAFTSIVATLVDRLRTHSTPDLPNRGLAAVAMMAMVERFTYYVTSRAVPFDEDAMFDSLATVIHRGFFGAR